MEHPQHEYRPIYPTGALVPNTRMLFTAYASPPRKTDATINFFRGYRGYLKPISPYWQGDLVIGESYRFLISAGPFTKNHHNYFYVIPFRDLASGEPKSSCIVDPEDFECMLNAARGLHKKPILTNRTIELDFEHMLSLDPRILA